MIKIVWQKGRTGKEILIQASWNPLHYVTLSVCLCLT